MDMKNENNENITKIIDIKEFDIGKDVIIVGEITQVIDTKGPEIIKIYDGTSKFTLKSFNGKTKLQINDIVKVRVSISSFRDNLEGSIKRIFVYKDKDVKDKITKQINNALLENAKIKNPNFLIKSEFYEKNKTLFHDIAYTIRKAVVEQRPIILRHHNDADGYSSGLAIEKGILSLMRDFHPNTNEWAYIKRSSLRTPFYDYTDCMKDITLMHDLTNRFNIVLKPLLIIVDAGSSSENIIALKRIKLEGYETIVIDHHYDNNGETIKYIDWHLNPHLLGENDGDIVAGFLSNEIGNLVSNTDLSNELKFGAMIAGYGDKSQALELKEYKKDFNDFDKELITKILRVIDFEKTYSKIDGYNLINSLMLPNKDKAIEITDILFDNIEAKISEFDNAMKEYNRQITDRNLILNMIDIRDVNYKIPFPSNVALISRLHDGIVSSNESKFVLTLGISDKSLSIRGSQNINDSKVRFSVKQLIKDLKTNFTNDVFDGGGHDLAGTIRYSPIAKEKIITFVIEYCKKIND